MIVAIDVSGHQHEEFMAFRLSTIGSMLLVAVGAASCGDHLPIGPILPMPAGAALAACVVACVLIVHARRHGLLPTDVE
ncbi:MAG TPA: hypothetical protein VF483_01890 [Gemmatimonadaceae bacterium]